MNELMDAIETKVMRSVRADHRRRRRHRIASTIVALSLTVTLSATAGYAAITGGLPRPLNDLLNGSTQQAAQSGTARLGLTLSDDAGLSWASVAYRTRAGMLAIASTPDSRAALGPTSGGASGYVVASELAQGPIAGLHYETARKGDTVRVLLAGTVDSRVSSVTISVNGVAMPAHLTLDELTLPVDVDVSSLTPEGRDLAKTLPKAVSVRLFAVAIDRPSSDGKNDLSVTATTTNADGTQNRQPLRPLCLSDTCLHGVVDLG